MSSASGGRATRRPVSHNGRPVVGLFERATTNGDRMFEVRHKIGGRAVRHTLAARGVAEAVREQRAWLAERDAGVRLVGRGDVTLAELRREWETWARNPGSPYSARSVELYTDLLDRHVLPLLGASTKAAAVTAPDLRLLIDRLNAKRLSGSSVHGILTATSALLRFAVRRGVIDTNPCRLLERGDRPSTKRRREPRYLNRSEIDRLLDHLGDEFRPVAATLAFAGLRVSEALALRWQDVDFDARMLHVPGTKTLASRQPVPIIDDLAAELRAHRARFPGVGDALVFTTGPGNRQWRHNVLRAFYAAGDAAGLNPPGSKRVGCHDLRHSCAGLLLSAGVSAPKVAAILRHSDTRTTLTVYAGVVESERASLRSDLETALRR